MNDGASRLDGGIRVVSAPFGGILVETALGGIAVNGGGTPDEMDGFYTEFTEIISKNYLSLFRVFCVFRC